MSGTEDEVLLIFLEESREHLAGIEEDLLAVEENGINIDQELVNRVFRAIHTVKGGSGFFALDKIKDLSHVMENILDLIRKERLEPGSEVINTLLEGADLLRSMINDPRIMDTLDISICTQKLERIRNGEPAESCEPALPQVQEDLVPIIGPENQIIFEISKTDLQMSRKEEKGGNLIYLVEYDLINDIERKNKNPWDVIKEALTLTYFIESKVDYGAVGSLHGNVEDMRIPFYVLLSTVMDKNLLSYFLGLPEEKIHTIQIRGSDLAMDKQEAKGAIPSIEEVMPKPEPQSSATKPKEKTESNSAPVSSPPVVQPRIAARADSDGDPDKKAQVAKAPVKGEGSVRVNLKVLDKLMTLAGELVLTRNQLLQSGSEENLQGMLTTSQSVDHLTTELQDAIMATRMQSIGLVFNKFKRIVRDMSGSLGKSIALTLEGEDVELDRTIIEKIGDPLTHLVRNSVDHGIEMPEDRLKSGKPAKGKLHLKAAHEAGFVVIDIIDDGQGLPVERIKKKALDSGIVTKSELENMTEKDIQLLIFRPGFSTATMVTDISGRGVGMDVVRTNIADLGGIVDLDSTPGEGTRMQIKLPLTLAILPSLMIEVERSRFAIPQANLLELVRVIAKDVKNRIEKIGDAPVIRLRGELLPLVSMKDVLGITSPTWTDESGNVHLDRRANIADRRSPVDGKAHESPLEENQRKDSDRRHSPDSSVNIAVVQAGNMKLGLIVDQLLDSSEIVVKPLGIHLKKARIFAGATILGDGSVALILDIFSIRQFMQLDQNAIKEMSEREKLNQNEALKDRHELLVVENGDDEFFAIPLDLVLRIEKIQTSDIQKTGGQKAIKYRGGSLGLFAIEDAATVQPRTPSDIASIIVFKVANREVGILVKQVIDIIQTSAEIDGFTHKQNGIFGSAIINDKITLFLDLYGIINHLAPQWVKDFRGKDAQVQGKGKTILLVEDSKFFMTQISEFLMEAGFKVITATDGTFGLEEMAKHHKEIDIIVTDIEMPNMDGYEMVTNIRKNIDFQELPILAVTSVSGEKAKDKGLKAGMDAYLIKLDREEILHHINGYLNHGRKWKR